MLRDNKEVLISENREGREYKYVVNEVVRSEQGYMLSYNGSDGLVSECLMPYGYDMVFTLSPKRRFGVLAKYSPTVGKLYDSPVAVALYGESIKLPVDQWYEIIRTGIVSKAYRELEGKKKLPTWIVAVVLGLVLLVGGVIAVGTCSNDDNSPPVEEEMPDSNVEPSIYVNRGI